MIAHDNGSAPMVEVTASDYAPWKLFILLDSFEFEFLLSPTFFWVTRLIIARLRQLDENALHE